MKCGTCGVTFSHVAFLFVHWKQTGCAWGRPVWEKVLESRRQGHSGRRLLHARWPTLWQSEPMPEEVKAKMREIAAQRKTVESKSLAKAKRKMRRIGK